MNSNSISLKNFLKKFFLKATCTLSDKIFLQLLFRLKMGKKLNLDNPQTFNEKLQWLKLYDRNPKYTIMVDKYAVKDYVSPIIGSEYIIPLIGVWDNVDEIDFDKLPQQFVLKTTHGGGGGGVIVCRDKSKLDISAAKRKLYFSLKSDLYKSFREWPYKNVPHRIIAEKVLFDPDYPDNSLNDYKFYCFDGVPKVVLISWGRFKGQVLFDYYDMDFQLLPFSQGGPNSGRKIDKPHNFEKMKELASKLSAGIPHARIDLYNIRGKIYFGEITFFDSSGFAPFSPEEWDYKFGNWIKLPNR